MAADAQALADLHAAAFDAPWSAAEIADLLAAPGVQLSTIDTPSGPVGFILCRAAAGEAEILTLAVHPGHRRRGYGRALVEAAAAALDAEAMFLEVASDNTAAIALYRHAGFIEVGKRRAYYARASGPAVDALVLRRDLNR